MRVDPVRTAIETLTAELGSKTNGIWRASFTVKDVLEKTEMPNTAGNQRYVIYTVGRFYEGSKVGPPQHDNGGTLEMKIRSI